MLVAVIASTTRTKFDWLFSALLWGFRLTLGLAIVQYFLFLAQVVNSNTVPIIIGAKIVNENGYFWDTLVFNDMSTKATLALPTIGFVATVAFYVVGILLASHCIKKSKQSL